MKCKFCDGTGTSNTCVNGTFKPCPACDGTGEYEPFDADVELDKLYPPEHTNEEWLDRKSTKEKAEWLFKLTYKCYWCGREYTPRSQSLYNEKECPFKKCMKDKKDFEKWLKEIYREG